MNTGSEICLKLSTVIKPQINSSKTKFNLKLSSLIQMYLLATDIQSEVCTAHLISKAFLISHFNLLAALIISRIFFPSSHFMYVHLISHRPISAIFPLQNNFPFADAPQTGNAIQWVER